MNAREIAELLHDQGFIARITAEMRAEITTDWTNAKTLEEREHQHIRLLAVDDFARLIQRTLDDGKFADRRLKD